MYNPTVSVLIGIIQRFVNFKGYIRDNYKVEFFFEPESNEEKPGQKIFLRVEMCKAIRFCFWVLTKKVPTLMSCQT